MMNFLIEQIVVRILVFTLTFFISLLFTFVSATQPSVKEKPLTVTYEVEILQPIEIKDSISNKTNKNTVQVIACNGFDVPPSLYLPIEIDEYQEITLHKKSFGNLSDTTKLENYLRDIFHQREISEIYNPATNVTEKTVVIRASQKLKYRDVLKLVETLRNTGASPIKLQFEGCLYKKRGECVPDRLLIY